MSDLRLTVRRESADKDVSKAFRKVSLKVHPDKGGNLGDFQKLSVANDTWKDALKNRGVPGRPRSAEEPAHRKPKPAAKRGQLGRQLIIFERGHCDEIAQSKFDVRPGIDEQ